MSNLWNNLEDEALDDTQEISEYLNRTGWYLCQGVWVHPIRYNLSDNADMDMAYRLQAGIDAGTLIYVRGCYNG